MSGENRARVQVGSVLPEQTAPCGPGTVESAARVPPPCLHPVSG